MSRKWAQEVWAALAAVLVGNGVYFLLLYPSLPSSWQHRPNVFDRGLVLDFLLCLLLYGLFRRAGRRLTGRKGGR